MVSNFHSMHNCNKTADSNIISGFNRLVIYKILFSHRYISFFKSVIVLVYSTTGPIIASSPIWHEPIILALTPMPLLFPNVTRLKKTTHLSILIFFPHFPNISFEQKTRTPPPPTRILREKMISVNICL